MISRLVVGSRGPGTVPVVQTGKSRPVTQQRWHHEPHGIDVAGAHALALAAPMPAAADADAVPACVKRSRLTNPFIGRPLGLEGRSGSP